MRLEISFDFFAPFSINWEATGASGMQRYRTNLQGERERHDLAVASKEALARLVLPREGCHKRHETGLFKRGASRSVERQVVPPPPLYYR